MSRHYRLVLPADHSIYNLTFFRKDVNRAEVSWYITIALVSELYRNDVGIDLTLVGDGALTFTAEEDQLFRRGSRVNDVVSDGMITLNKHCDPKKYDLAVILTGYREKYSGMIIIYSVCEQYSKTNVTIHPIKPPIITHEVGHIFGVDHAFSNRRQYSSRTEIGAE